MLNFLNFFKDQTSDWKECLRIPLSLNLYSNSLNNVVIGDSYEKLQTFGRPDNRKPFKSDNFIYYPLGLQIRGENGKIGFFYFTIRIEEELIEIDETEALYIPTELSILSRNGGQFLVNKDTSPAAVERVFGNPSEKDEDVDFLSMIYEFDNLFLDFTFGKDNLLYSVYFGR
jgi:hypothetical protein